MKTLVVILFTAGWLHAQEPFSAEFDIRNRFVTGDKGQVYRSIVNLGEGPRLFDALVRYEGKDRIDFSAHNWGGDPNSELRFDLRREKVYEFQLQYRDLAYFNNLPSYANPLLAQGAVTSQRAIDLRRNQLDMEFRFKPRSRVTPFFGLLRTSGDGHGITPFVGSGDEFPVPTTFGDKLTTARGGVQFNGESWTATLEQGWTGYTDEQTLDSNVNGGNRQDTIVLGHLLEKYRGSGSGPFTRGFFQAQPLQQLALSGHFVYSRPELEVAHELNAEGSFQDPATLRPFTTLVEQSFADANQPHTSGTFSAEFRPHPRWRLRYNWFSDDFEISGASRTAAMLEPVSSPRTHLNLHYDQSETEISGDIGRALTVRAGHRYVRSDTDLPPADLIFPETMNNPRIRRNVALAGATFSFWKGRARLNGDFEGSPGGETYFRTGLQDYRKLALQGRLRITDALQVTGLWKTLSNDNVGIDFQSRQAAVTVEWTPNQSRRTILVGTYSRETIDSTSVFIDPTFFRRDISIYSDRGHHGSAYADVRLMGGVVLHAGGAFSWSEGTRPTRYYVPRARLIAPATKRLDIVGEWHWYSYSSIEAFRAHDLSVGTRIRLGSLQSIR
jgi:hypothetical protein